MGFEEDAMVTREPGTRLSEKLGASAGAWAVLYLCIHYWILRGTSADPRLAGDEYVRALLSERMAWEWATALRVLGGIMLIWFMGSLAGRLRMAEGEPGRLASIGFGIGVVWGSVWLFSAMFNSAGLMLAIYYLNPEGARLTGALAHEIVSILTPSLVFTLSLATAFVAFRFGGFPKSYTYATGIFSVLILGLAIAEWYGPGNLGNLILALAFAWTAATSLLLVPEYRPADLLRGRR
jgi:hypothetical protein